MAYLNLAFFLGHPELHDLGNGVAIPSTAMCLFGFIKTYFNSLTFSHALLNLGQPDSCKQPQSFASLPMVTVLNCNSLLSSALTEITYILAF